jgi:membrane fusion protein (multidrug efflux system)
VIVSRKGLSEFVSVETGLRDKDKVQILKGISEGDTVLTSGLMFVKPGAELILTNVE